MDKQQTRQGSSSALSIILLALVILYMGLVAFKMREFVMDDAYIGLRCVENLLAGNGLVFNPGERVESVTNVGWLLVLAALAPLAPLPTLVKIVGFICAVTAVILCFGLARRVYGSSPNSVLLILPVPFFLAVHFDYMFYSVCGMETGLLALLLCAMVYAAIGGQAIALAIMGAAATLLHPECILIFPLWWLATLRRENPAPVMRWLSAGVFVALVANICVARYSYYGDLLPNTFYSKPSTLPGALNSIHGAFAGANANFPAPFRGILALPFLVFGAISLQRKIPGAGAIAAAVVAAGWVFCAYAQPDWTGTGRYFAPYLPVAFLLLWIGLVDAHKILIERLAPRLRIGPIVLTYAVLIAAIGAGNMVRRLSDEFVDSYPGYVLAGRVLTEPCQWIAANTAPEAVIATRRIGAVGFITGREVFDYAFGLIHRDVARRIKTVGEPFDDPNDPELDDLWRQHAPDYFLEDSWIVERTAADAGGDPSRFELHGFEYGVFKRFPIGPEAEWVLCRRLENTDAPFEEDAQSP